MSPQATGGGTDAYDVTVIARRVPLPGGATFLDVEAPDLSWVTIRLGAATSFPEGMSEVGRVALALTDRRIARAVRGRSVRLSRTPRLGRFEWTVTVAPDQAASVARRLHERLREPVTIAEAEAAAVLATRRLHERCFTAAVDAAVARAAGRALPSTERPAGRALARSVERRLRALFSEARAVLAVGGPSERERRAVAEALAPVFAPSAPAPPTETRHPARAPDRTGGHPRAIVRIPRGPANLVAVRLWTDTDPRTRALLRLAVAHLAERIDVRLATTGPAAVVVIRLRPTASPPAAFPPASLARIQHELAAPWSDAAVRATAERYLGARLVQAALAYEDPTGVAVEALDLAGSPGGGKAALDAEAAALLQASSDDVAVFARQALDPARAPGRWVLGYCGPTTGPDGS